MWELGIKPADLIVYILLASLEVFAIWHATRELNRYKQFIEDRPTIGDFLAQKQDDENPDSPTNLQVIARVFGQELLTYDHFKYVGLKSGQARQQQMIDYELDQALVEKTPMGETIKGFLEGLGLEKFATPQYIGMVQNYLKRKGYIGKEQKMFQSRGASGKW